MGPGPRLGVVHRLTGAGHGRRGPSARSAEELIRGYKEWATSARAGAGPETRGAVNESAVSAVEAGGRADGARRPHSGGPPMRIRASGLWRLDRTIDRLPDFAIGVSLTFVKMVIGYLVATRLFGREWTPFDYAVPKQVTGLLSLTLEDRFFYRVMLLVALPFIACGVALTVRRLRSAGLPLYAVLLFFSPMPMNLIFYLVLSVLPARPIKDQPPGLMDDVWDPAPAPKKVAVLDRAIPESRPGAAIAAILWPMPFALAFTALSVNVLRDYGWGVFVGIPFTLPM